jgi:selenium metabolism protein yedF|nr:sulfurtransferase-like selenium metabolism protein YedF [uncultured Oribacterium sp.]
MNKKLNCMGMACPLPVVEAKKAIDEMEDGLLEIEVDNETCVQNLRRLAAKYDFTVASESISDKEFLVKMEVKKDHALKGKQEDSCTVVFSSDKMGEGDEELGKNLMKSFVFALSNVDPLPTAMVFYNRGAFLTSEDSPVLADLKNLEKAGVKIMTCGLCADYYKIKEKLGVGVISNMYEIVETQMESQKIIKP